MKNEHFDIEPRGKENYEVPTCKVIEIQSEGVLCSSIYGGTDGFEEDNYDDIWN